MSDNSYQLIVRTGPKPGHVYTLISDSMVIGRDPNSDIVINDAEVSRQHARLSLIGGSYQLQDMGSTNGSFIDGSRLEGNAVTLKNNQLIQLGSNVELVYQVIEGVDPMATMVAPMGALPGMGAAMAEEAEEEEDVDTGVLESPPDSAFDAEPASITAFDEKDEEPEPLPSFDEPLPSFDEPVAEIEEVAAPVEDALPAFNQPADDATMIFSESMDEALPSFDEPVAEKPAAAAEEVLPSFDEPDPLPSFDEPEPLPSFGEPEPLPSFGEPEPLPSFDEPAKAEPMMAKSEPPPLPSFDPEPAAAEISKSGGAKSEGGGGFFSNRRNVIIAVVAVVALCICCASSIGAYAYFVGF
ncbi:MAG: FHA domain-containing protein [Anaerolineales bacterium]|nr:FHA domain-containing protein [Anaerolineales bacterium]MCB8960369.1 FHA domain-containing protein [Ardenticatenales bacterium]